MTPRAGELVGKQTLPYAAGGSVSRDRPRKGDSAVAIKHDTRRKTSDIVKPLTPCGNLEHGSSDTGEKFFIATPSVTPGDGKIQNRGRVRLSTGAGGERKL